MRRPAWRSLVYLGWTPLHTALQHEQVKTAERLLQLGANADIRSRQGKTILAMAEDEGAPRELLTIIVRAVR